MMSDESSRFREGVFAENAAGKADEPKERTKQKRDPHFPGDDALTPPMLIGMISRMHINLMRNTEAPGSVMSQNSCRVLIRCLAREDGLTQLELSRRTRLKPPTVSVALGRLENLGYVVREVSPNDGREVNVRLTGAGRALEDLTRERLRAADDIAMRDVTPEESTELRRILLKIKNALAENENSADPRDKN